MSSTNLPSHRGGKRNGRGGHGRRPFRSRNYNTLSRPLTVGRGVRIVPVKGSSTDTVVIMGLPEEIAADIEAAVKSFGNVSSFFHRNSRFGKFVCFAKYEEPASAERCVKELHEKAFGDATASVTFKRTRGGIKRVTRVDNPDGPVDPLRVWVGNVGHVNEETLREIFPNATELKTTRQNAFITFETVDAANKAIEKDGSTIEDQVIKVEHQRPAPIYQEEEVRGMRIPNKIKVFPVGEVSDDDIKSTVDNVESITRTKNNVTAFITFTTPRDASAAARTIKTIIHDGKPVRVSPYVEYVTEAEFAERIAAKPKREAKPRAERAPRAERPPRAERAPRAPRAKAERKPRGPRPPPAGISDEDIAKTQSSVFVANIKDVEEDAVKGMFAGTVVSYEVKSQQSALIQFASKEEADAALKVNGTTINDSTRLRVRAARYPKPAFTGPPSKLVVYVSGFPRTVTSEATQAAFPGASSVQLFKRFRPFAFVTFESEESAQAAVNHNGDKLLGSDAIVVQFSRSPSHQ